MSLKAPLLVDPEVEVGPVVLRRDVQLVVVAAVVTAVLRVRRSAQALLLHLDDVTAEVWSYWSKKVLGQRVSFL